MLCIEAPDVAQAKLSGREALVIAQERFSYLGSAGILPPNKFRQPIDPSQIETAMAFLRRCRRTKAPRVHSFDLRRLIGVQLGAVIAASVALGFETRNWLGETTFGAHVMIAVNAADAKRIAAAKSRFVSAR
jgi:hypothetical protein